MHPAHLTNKVGLVPYGTNSAGERVFLIHLPKAKNPAEQGSMMWGLVRGTVRDVQGRDLRSLEALRATPPERIEPAAQTALHEAEEECGLTPVLFDRITLRDHGLMDYHSLKKPPYPIHFFSVQVNPKALETLKANATDAADLAFKTLQEAKAMTKNNHFKPGYLAILAQINDDLGG